MVAPAQTGAVLAALPTPTQWLQLIVLSAIPIGLGLLTVKTKTFKWFDMLHAVAILFIPVLLVLVINDALPSSAVAILLGIMLAYFMSLVDTD
ncbi:MAG: hypothetical protein ABEJ42_04880 [Halobacteriaceae archaeon]